MTLAEFEQYAVQPLEDRFAVVDLHTTARNAVVCSHDSLDKAVRAAANLNHRTAQKEATDMAATTPDPKAAADAAVALRDALAICKPLVRAAVAAHAPNESVNPGLIRSEIDNVVGAYSKEHGLTSDDHTVLVQALQDALDVTPEGRPAPKAPARKRAPRTGKVTSKPAGGVRVPEVEAAVAPAIGVEPKRGRRVQSDAAKRGRAAQKRVAEKAATAPARRGKPGHHYIVIAPVGASEKAILAAAKRPVEKGLGFAGGREKVRGMVSANQGQVVYLMLNREGPADLVDARRNTAAQGKADPAGARVSIVFKAQAAKS